MEARQNVVCQDVAIGSALVTSTLILGLVSYPFTLYFFELLKILFLNLRRLHYGQVRNQDKNNVHANAENITRCGSGDVSICVAIKLSALKIFVLPTRIWHISLVSLTRLWSFTFIHNVFVILLMGVKQYFK